MEHLKLAASKRDRGTKGKLAAIRREGRVPGVVYGPKSEPTMVEVQAAEMRAILNKRNHVIEMNLEGQVQNVMVKQVERDPIRRDLVHIDFLRVDEIHPVTVSVPVIPQGIPVGVKLQGGVLFVSKKSVKLRAKVNDIPESFVVDVSELESGKTVYVKDLPFDKSKGVFVTPARTALFGVGQARKEEEIAPAATAAPAAAAPAATPAAGDGKDKAAPAAGGKAGAKPSK